MGKKAVIFDLDGTLTDTIHSIKFSGDQAFAPFGIGPFSEREYQYFVGDGAANLVKRALTAGGDEKLVHYEDALARYLEIFGRYCMYRVEPYPGILELLEKLRGLGIRRAVLSNKPHENTLQVIRDVFGTDRFDAVQGQTEGVPVKPDPAGAIRILEKLGLAPEDVVYLGDTGTDMKTGKGCGCFTVGALWGFRERQELLENRADALIGHPLELLEYL